MDVDPLADTVPPRHAVESDDEEDEYNPLSPSTEDTPPSVEVKIVGSLPQKTSLVVCSEDIGKYWARGANLGEQSGAIFVNNIQVGLAFNPSWTTSTVIVSEVTTRLPTWAMHKYALAILEQLEPSSVGILDVYPSTGYISPDSRPPPFYEAPIRYLCISQPSPQLLEKAQLFAPPNLLQSTSVSFLSIVATTQFTSNITGTALLLPSPYFPSPRPKTLERSNFSHISEDRIQWEPETIRTAQELLFLSIGQPNLTKWEAQPVKEGNQAGKSSRPKPGSEIGEGSMYI